MKAADKALKKYRNLVVITDHDWKIIIISRVLLWEEGLWWFIKN